MLDGAMGTMLQAKGLKAGEMPELLSLTHADTIVQIHKEYIQAGAQVVYTNTFGANRYKLSDYKASVQQVIGAAVENARRACEGTNTLVALDIGPVGKLLEPNGTLAFEQAYDIFKEQVLAGQGADLIVLETMTDLYELKAALLAVKENSALPVMCTMTFEQNMRTFTGCSVPAMALTLSGLGADAIGVNCSLGPDELYPIVEELVKWTKLPIAVKPNAGLPDPVTNQYNVTPQDFAESIRRLLPLGVQVVGGCCGTTPEYMRQVKKALCGHAPVKRRVQVPHAVCSAAKTVRTDCPRIVGERINPTGKKRFKEALKNNDMDYILAQAIEQVRAGAEILDVNVGLPEVDEKNMMVKAVKALQSVTDAPLQIDSTNPQVLQAALRVYNGKPVVNSVNGEEKSLCTVLPLVKKYGAAVIGLTLDENGIPQTAQGRFAIAKRIVDRACALGIEKGDIFIDCLTLTASAEQEGAMQTLLALKRVKEELGVKTALGVSNISFGLPNRELVNATFLAMALQNGLDLPIINPNAAAMTGAVRAYRLLANIDRNAVEFIAAYNKDKIEQEKKVEDSGEIDLPYAIENGLKGDCARLTQKLLETTGAMDIVNGILIPALDKTGVQFEQGKIFLPQLIQSATAAQSCFEVIKKKLADDKGTPVSKGKIVLATVKGDIHDIGKNIVKVLLENYGYTVLDLGKDVPPQAVLEAVRANKVRLVGLSALMTTTLCSMEDTIALLKKSGCSCKVMVGGAVLTAEYAQKIGADYYCRDAKESVDTARLVLG